MRQLESSADGGPTHFRGLNTLLTELTERARTILGRNFVGAYLQGSFALGEGDIYSDCDFLIPVHFSISPEQEAALRALHYEIPNRRGHWPHQLEGAYPPKEELRTLSALGRPWLYVHHGWRQMTWSDRCNTDVARWTLRERGIRLAGPDPRTLVDPIPPQVMQDRMRAYAAEFLPDLLGWLSFDIAWTQPYVVTTFCRILYTAETGALISKRAALEWGLDHLDPRWADLLCQAVRDRSLGWRPLERPRPGSVDQTLAFAEYARQRAGSLSRAWPGHSSSRSPGTVEKPGRPWPRTS